MAAAGIGVPKALVPVGGVPQAVRLVRTLGRLGAQSVTCLLREGVPPALLEAEAALGVPLTLRYCRTPSSLHTLAQGLAAVPAGPVICTMVDTVMPWPDWRRAFDAIGRGLAGGADAVLVVTPHVQDERPLYVRRDAAGRVREIGGPAADPACVTAGVYGFGEAARADAEAAVDAGVERMRGFLGRLVRDGARVESVEVARVIDLDDARDLAAANAWQEFCEEEDAPST
jgi:hypothetical protein